MKLSAAARRRSLSFLLMLAKMAGKLTVSSRGVPTEQALNRLLL